MSFADIVRMCLDNLKRRKGRTILTVLGVFIGCTSIVVMVSIGIGMTESTNQMLEEMGDLSIIELSQGYSSTGNIEEEKLDETPEFDKFIAAARREILAQLAMKKVFASVEVSDEECKAFYDQNPQFFQQGESVSAKHILVKEEDECLKVLAAINAGEQTFEDAAKSCSTCPSKERGGDLGAFGRGQMVPEFEEAAFAAEIGAVVGPVKTQFGYHLIKVENKIEATTVPFEQMVEQIRGSLMQQKQGDAYNAKVEELKAKYMA